MRTPPPDAVLCGPTTTMASPHLAAASSPPCHPLHKDMPRGPGRGKGLCRKVDMPPLTSEDASSRDTPPSSPEDVSGGPTPVHYASEAGSSTGVGSDRPTELRIEGQTFFPIHATRVISHIFKSRYTGIWPNWSSVPNEQKEIWWKEFRKYFCWQPSIDRDIHKLFEKQGGARLKDAINKVKKVDKKPLWIPEECWAGLQKYWASKKFQDKSKKSKKNRASNTGLHTAGSIPIAEHKRRMHDELGRDPEVDELFMRTHKKANSSFVNQKSQQIYEDFMRRKKQARKKFSSRDQSSTQRSQLNLWTEVVGGMKKGRLYGLGSVAYGLGSEAIVVSRSGPTTPQPSSPEKMQQMVAREVEKVTEPLHQKIAQQQKMIEQLVQQQTMLKEQFSQTGRLRPPSSE